MTPAAWLVDVAATVLWIAVTLAVGAFVRHHAAGATRAGGALALAAGAGVALAVTASVLLAASVPASVASERALLAGVLATAGALVSLRAPRPVMLAAATLTGVLLVAGSLLVWHALPVASVLLAAVGLLVTIDAWKTENGVARKARAA